MKKLTAITYARKSVKVKDVSADDSVNYQVAKMERYAKEHNYQIVKRYSDVGYTGATTDRPELIEMLQDLDVLKVDTLLVYSVDRFGRDLKNNISTMLTILEKVTQVVFISEGIISNSEYFKLLYLIFTASAQEEREKILRRTSDGRLAKVLGRKVYDGKYPLGYVKDPATEVITPATPANTDNQSKLVEIRIIKYVFYCFLFGMSLRGIAKQLNASFGPTSRGKDWCYKSVQYILSNRVYSGYLYGTLNGNQHYFMESDSIVPFIDPLFQEKIIRMLSYQKPGRKKKLETSFPAFCLCQKCGNFINFTNETANCNFCSYLVDAHSILLTITKATKTLIQRKLKKVNQSLALRDLKIQYQMKLKKLKKKLIQLGENQKQIQVCSEFDEKTKKRLMEINTEAISKIILEESIITKIHNRISEGNSPGQLLNCYEFSLPYITVFDWENKEISIAFHPECFVKENSI